MFDAAELDRLIAYEDLQRAGYPIEAEDAFAAWEHGDAYEPPWYAALPDYIRHEIDALNWRARH